MARGPVNYYKKILELINSLNQEGKASLNVQVSDSNDSNSFAVSFDIDGVTFTYKSWLLADMYLLQAIYPFTSKGMTVFEDDDVKRLFNTLRSIYV